MPVSKNNDKREQILELEALTGRSVKGLRQCAKVLAMGREVLDKRNLHDRNNGNDVQCNLQQRYGLAHVGAVE